MFCADSNLLSAGTCYGDSGGPAMIRDESGLAYTLVGVVSGNPVGCTKTKVFPDYFTYVGHDEVCSRNQWSNWNVSYCLDSSLDQVFGGGNTTEFW